MPKALIALDRGLALQRIVCDLMAQADPDAPVVRLAWLAQADLEEALEALAKEAGVRVA